MPPGFSSRETKTIRRLGSFLGACEDVTFSNLPKVTIDVNHAWTIYSDKTQFLVEDCGHTQSREAGADDHYVEATMMMRLRHQSALEQEDCGSWFQTFDPVTPALFLAETAARTAWW